MRVVEIYEAGSFPILVLDSKKQFAASYGLDSEYWKHFAIEEAPEVESYLKSNLEDLANHYHALYQEPELAETQSENFDEALHWYRAYLASFPAEEESPAINHQLADLLLEHEDFGEAAREYEKTAYSYPANEKASDAGYAAIYAHREHQKAAADEEQSAVRREAVTSTLRFVDTFPGHEQAAVVLGAAVDDLYEMEEFELCIARGQSLLEGHPDADESIRRSAWMALAHSYFDLGRFALSEGAYVKVLETTPESDDSRQAVIDNLAAAIYKQGEAADLAQDHRAAADHYLRITRAAPTSSIRPAAEYDAGAALIRLEEWAEAATVLDAFRKTHPDHELHEEATKQIAQVRRSEGRLELAAAEYERVAAEADDSELRSEAMLLAGELYEEAERAGEALRVYLSYLKAFPKPLETAVETRSDIARIHLELGDEKAYRKQLKKIVAADRNAGAERTDRIRHLAALAALVPAQDRFQHFAELQLSQPFERNLQEKQRRMKKALTGFGDLLQYEVGEVTAAATYYMAEIYSNFSRALLESERPTDLAPGELQDYEMVLEEEAFPFEEKAIVVHQKNLELMAAGVFNPWIQKSLGQLATLMPGRYAKFEVSSGLIASLDRYSYRAPVAPAPPVPEDSAPAAPTPEAGEAGETEAVSQERPPETLEAG
jgi:outer membrane protein assembly factor BamD (BamD/ComL family)